jgi:hypothetical protein
VRKKREKKRRAWIGWGDISIFSFACDWLRRVRERVSVWVRVCVWVVRRGRSMSDQIKSNLIKFKRSQHPLTLVKTPEPTGSRAHGQHLRAHGSKGGTGGGRTECAMGKKMVGKLKESDPITPRPWHKSQYLRSEVRDPAFRRFQISSWIIRRAVYIVGPKSPCPSPQAGIQTYYKKILVSQTKII